MVKGRKIKEFHTVGTPFPPHEPTRLQPPHCYSPPGWEQELGGGGSLVSGEKGRVFW